MVLLDNKTTSGLTYKEKPMVRVKRVFMHIPREGLRFCFDWILGSRAPHCLAGCKDVVSYAQRVCRNC